MDKVIDTFGNFEDIVCRIVENVLADGSVTYDVRIYSPGGSVVRDLACEDLLHARKIFDSISSCL